MVSKRSKRIQKGFAVEPQETTQKGYYRQKKFNTEFNKLNNLKNIQIGKVFGDGEYILLPGWRLGKLVEYVEQGVYIPFNLHIRGSEPIPIIIVPGAVEIQ